MRYLTIAIVVCLATVVAAEEMAVTVYNAGIGVVSEERALEFEKGTNRLAFKDVPAKIDAGSVRFELVDGSDRVGILEQNYAFDLVRPEKVYARYIDQEIEMIDKDGRAYTGVLLSSNSGSVILRDFNDRIKLVRMDNIAEVSFPKLPEGLITRPTLFWLYNSKHEGSLSTRVSYQTAGLSWAAEYVGVLDADEKRLGLSGWAQIDNTSGKTYQDAKLKLIAGDISRAQPQRSRMYSQPMEKFSVAGADAAGFDEKAFFEYHMYTLPRKATLADNEKKQISLFDPAETGVEKLFTYRPDRNPTEVEVAIRFTNSEKDGLGMPLPAGRVRLFKADDDGSLVLLGEDLLYHTPRDEEITMKVGKAFDIVGEYRQMKENVISSRVVERQFQIELRNRKDTQEKVLVEKAMYGDWDVVESTQPHKRKDARTLQFELTVPARTTLTLDFTVRFTSR